MVYHVAVIRSNHYRTLIHIRYLPRARAIANATPTITSGTHINPMLCVCCVKFNLHFNFTATKIRKKNEKKNRVLISIACPFNVFVSRLIFHCEIFESIFRRFQFSMFLCPFELNQKLNMHRGNWFVFQSSLRNNVPLDLILSCSCFFMLNLFPRSFSRSDTGIHAFLHIVYLFASFLRWFSIFSYRAETVRRVLDKSSRNKKYTKWIKWDSLKEKL